MMTSDDKDDDAGDGVLMVLLLIMMVFVNVLTQMMYIDESANVIIQSK